MRGFYGEEEEQHRFVKSSKMLDAGVLPRCHFGKKRLVQMRKIGFDLGIRSGEDMCLAVLFGRLSVDGEGSRFDDAALRREIEGLDYGAYTESGLLPLD